MQFKSTVGDAAAYAALLVRAWQPPLQVNQVLKCFFDEMVCFLVVTSIIVCIVGA